MEHNPDAQINTMLQSQTITKKGMPITWANRQESIDPNPWRSQYDIVA